MTYPEHIFIWGAGALGSALGSLLFNVAKVTLISRNLAHIQSIQNHGLIIRGKLNTTVHLDAIPPPLSSLPPNAYVFLTTKRYDVQSCLEQLSPIVRPDTVLICLQNGIHIKEDVLSFFSLQKIQPTVLRAITTCGATFLNPGEIALNDTGQFNIEQSSPPPFSLEPFFEPTPNISHLEWKKFIFNCISNPMTALLDIQNKDLAHPEILEIQKNLCSEAVTVAQAEGHEFSEDLVSECHSIIARSENLSSMLQDIKRGKQTEIDYLNGEIVRLGEKHGIKTPYNHSITAWVKAKSLL